MSVCPDWGSLSMTSRSCLLVGAVIMVYGAIFILTHPEAGMDVNIRHSVKYPSMQRGKVKSLLPRQALDTDYSSNSGRDNTEGSSDTQQWNSSSSDTGRAVQPNKGQIPKPQPVQIRAPQTTPERQELNDVEVINCQELHFASPPNLTLTALASFPGSGNTWVRHLLQQATGLYTGSIYSAPPLLSAGFAGDTRTDRSVLTIKTHLHLWDAIKQYENAVLIMRNPAEALLAEFNREKAGKVGQAPQELYSSEAWTQYLRWQCRQYRDFSIAWLKNDTREKYIVRYEDLKKDLGPPLNGVVKYLLGKDIDSEVLQCIYKNSEGKFHRNASKEEHFDPFFEPWKQKIKDLEADTNAMLDNCLRSGRCIDYLRL